jgi:hypothetical protein
VAAFRMWNRMLTGEDRHRLVADQDRKRLLERLWTSRNILNKKRLSLAEIKEMESDKKHFAVDWKFAHVAYGGTAGMWMHLRGVSHVQAVLDVAVGLGFANSSTREWLLREFHDLYDSQKALKEAIARIPLLLVESPSNAYWKGKSIDIDWERNRALWSFFWKLCSKSKRSQWCRESDFGDDLSRTALSTRKDRLVNHDEFPSDLGLLIESKPNMGYRLDPNRIAPQDIRLFVVEQEDKLKELTS